MKPPDIAEKVKEYITENGYVGAQKDDGATPRPPISISKLGNCARRLWYDMHWDGKTKGKTFDSRTYTVFRHGDWFEEDIIPTLRTVLESEPGWKLKNTILEGQKQVALAVNGDAITGSPDGIIYYHSEPWAVLEIKTMSDYSFNHKFEKNIKTTGEGWGPDENYWWQNQGYMQAVGVDWSYVFGVNKNSGYITGCWQKRDPGFIEKLQKHISRVFDVDNQTFPDRILPDGTELKPDKKGKLKYPCTYCPHYESCWPQVESGVTFGGRFGTPKKELAVK